MEGVEELSRALLALSMQVVDQESADGLGTVRLMLMEVDGGRFRSMFDKWGCKTYASLRHALDHYYLTCFQQRIRWESPSITAYHEDFVQACLLVLDLALRSGKSAFIEGMLALDAQQQQILQPFVKAVTEQSFLQRAEGEKRDDGVLQLLQQNERLKRLCDQWANKYQDLRAEHDELKAVHERAAEELHLLRQDHQLLNQIGGSGTVEQALEKVRRDYADYDRMIQRLKKELEEKKGQLAQREEDMRTLQATFNAQRTQEKAEQLELAQQRIRALQQETRTIRLQEEETRTALQLCHDNLQQRESETQELQRRVGELQAQAQKFMNIRRLHHQYREKILKEYKEARE